MELEPKFISNYLVSIKLYTLEVLVNLENLIKLFGPIKVQGIKKTKNHDKAILKLFFY